MTLMTLEIESSRRCKKIIRTVISFTILCLENGRKELLADKELLIIFNFKLRGVLDNKRRNSSNWNCSRYHYNTNGQALDANRQISRDSYVKEFGYEMKEESIGTEPTGTEWLIKQFWRLFGKSVWFLKQGDCFWKEFQKIIMVNWTIYSNDGLGKTILTSMNKETETTTNFGVMKECIILIENS